MAFRILSRSGPFVLAYKPLCTGIFCKTDDRSRTVPLTDYRKLHDKDVIFRRIRRLQKIWRGTSRNHRLPRIRRTHPVDGFAKSNPEI